MSTAIAPSAGASAALEQDQHQYLTFVLGRETLAIGILVIKEILEYGQPTEVPMMPTYIRGVINLRGAVVPVVDLAARFQRSSTPATKKTCIVIVEVDLVGERHIIGVVVDAVNEVLEIPRTEIEPPPAFGTSIRNEFIAGLGKVNGKFVVILDIDRVLAIDALSGIAADAESS